MTMVHLSEERRRELAAFLPALVEARRREPAWQDPGVARQFWNRSIVDLRAANPGTNWSAAGRVWLIRHAYLAVAGFDPATCEDFLWPGICAGTGNTAAAERWPLEPVPDANKPPSEHPKESVLVRASDIINQAMREQMDRVCAGIDTAFKPAAPTTSNPENTMNQATISNARSLTIDTSNIVEVKTFVFGRDITTLNDDDLLEYVQRLTATVEHLEDLNAKTPLAKLVTKIAQLKDAKAKIVDLLGGAPVEDTTTDEDAKPKRVRRTKAEVEADNAAQAKVTPPAPPAPSAKADSEPTSIDDLDLE